MATELLYPQYAPAARPGPPQSTAIQGPHLAPVTPSPTSRVPRSIYLAGKIGPNDWRHKVVPGLRAVDWDSRTTDWPVLKHAIGGNAAWDWRSRTTSGGILDYTGPFFISDDHGCGHGPCTHGASGDGDQDCCNYVLTDERRKQIRRLCFRAIARSDLIFAWINDLTGYGTLTELGYAAGLGKRIAIASPTPPDFSPTEWPHAGYDPHYGDGPLAELWFAFSLADAVIPCTDPAEMVLGLAAVAAEHAVPALPATASPIEVQFWKAHHQLRMPEMSGLVYNHPFNGGQYKIDFALPARKIGIELDGFRNHSSTADIAHDRRRQRALEAAGWYITRFGGSEVHHDAGGCVRQAAALIRSRNGGSS